MSAPRNHTMDIHRYMAQSGPAIPSFGSRWICRKDGREVRVVSKDLIQRYASGPEVALRNVATGRLSYIRLLTFHARYAPKRRKRHG